MLIKFAGRAGCFRAGRPCILMAVSQARLQVNNDLVPRTWACFQDQKGDVYFLQEVALSKRHFHFPTSADSVEEKDAGIVLFQACMRWRSLVQRYEELLMIPISLRPMLSYNQHLFATAPSDQDAALSSTI